MTQAKIVWLQRVNGRYPGHEETVELTPYIEALAKNRRLDIVETLRPAPILGVFVAEPAPDTDAMSDDPVIESYPDLDAPITEDTYESAPKPRAPRRKVQRPKAVGE
jgi:hypothetical protein